MAYFNSLNDWKSTQDAVAQHTTDTENAVLQAKAAASSAAFEGYSQLLETAGGGVSSLSGGIHLTRKIYKKFKAVKQAAKDAKKKVPQTGDDALYLSYGFIEDGLFNTELAK